MLKILVLIVEKSASQHFGLATVIDADYDVTTMYENYITMAVGVVLIAASVLAKGISYGMPSHRQKRVSPATRPVRVVLLSVGLLSLAVGLIGVLRG